VIALCLACGFSRKGSNRPLVHLSDVGLGSHNNQDGFRPFALSNRFFKAREKILLTPQPLDVQMNP
jgi:hypothetical protein